MKTRKLIQLVFISLLLLGCKKQYKEDTVVHFHLYNPVTNEAYSNVTVKIVETEDVGPSFQISNEYKYKTIWEGKTDVYGKASHSFKAYKKDKFTYWHYVDESFSIGKKKIKQPEYGPLTKNQINSKNYHLADNINVIKWIKNITCFDENDLCRYRYKSIVNEYGSWSSWIPANPFNYYEGCMDYLTSVQTHTQDIWEIEMEVTKNGITTIIRDTSYLTGQNGTDTLKIFY